MLKLVEVVHNDANFAQLPRLVQSLDFDAITWRQDAEGSAHNKTRSVYLRTVSHLTEINVFHEILATTTKVTEDNIWCEELLRWLQKELRLAVMGRAMFVELAPNSLIDSHEDQGMYCASYNRYHMPIITNQYCKVMVGADEQHMEVGSIYQINNKQTHCAWNYGDTPRIHLIFDAIPFRGINT